MDSRWWVVLGGIGCLLLLVLGLAIGVGVAESGTVVEGTVVTTHVGNVTETTDELVLVVRGDSRFATGLTERLDDRLTSEGYVIQRADSLDGVDRSRVLVVDVTRADLQPGILTHQATLAVETYYTNHWNQPNYEAYRRNGSVSATDDGVMVVGGEFRIHDRTRGLPGRYRARLTAAMVDVVVDDFRGDWPA